MKRAIPAISFAIIFGILIGWAEMALPLFDLGKYNIIDIGFAFFLLSLLVVLVLVIFSGNIVTAVLSTAVFVLSYLGVRFYLGANISFPVIVRLSTISVAALWCAVFYYWGNSLVLRYKSKTKIRSDLAFPLIFVFASLLFALSVTLMEQNVIAFNVLNIFYGYLYFLVSVLLLFAFLSFNEIAGFLIGLLSIPVYFLAMRLISNNFDFAFLIANEREFLIVVFSYSVLFALSASLVGKSGSIFLKGVRYRRAYKKLAGAGESLPEIPEKEKVSGAAETWGSPSKAEVSSKEGSVSENPEENPEEPSEPSVSEESSAKETNKDKPVD